MKEKEVEEREEGCLNYCGLVLCVKPQWEEMKHVPEMYGCLIIKATVKLVPRCSTHNDQQAPFLQPNCGSKKFEDRFNTVGFCTNDPDLHSYTR